MSLQVIARLEALSPGTLTPAQIGRTPVVLTLHDGKVLAVAARCPHQGANLCAGMVTGYVEPGEDGDAVQVDTGRAILRCPWHGFEFDLYNGEPTVASPAHRRLRLRRFAVRVIDGDVVAEERAP